MITLTLDTEHAGTLETVLRQSLEKRINTYTFAAETYRQKLIREIFNALEEELKTNG